MSVKTNKRFAVTSLFIVFAIYFVGSSIAMFTYHKKLQTEKQRTYNIAYYTELVKHLLRDAGGKFSKELLESKLRGLEIEEYTDEENRSLIKEGQKIYMMIYAPPDTNEKDKLDRYFSYNVLSNYFYVVTESNGKIVEMFWDKP